MEVLPYTQVIEQILTCLPLVGADPPSYRSTPLALPCSRGLVDRGKSRSTGLDPAYLEPGRDCTLSRASTYPYPPTRGSASEVQPS